MLQVAHEWLSTGRGEMALPSEGGDGPPPGEQIENPVERRLLRAWRRLPARPRIALLELVEAYRGARRKP